VLARSSNRYLNFLLSTAIYPLYLALLTAVSSVATAAVVIPDPDSHRQFLLHEWREGLPSLVVFKDPYCPYCVRAMEGRARLDNYNVFIFWAPILGDRSIDRVETFFTCNSPVDENVIKAVLTRKKPQCSGPSDEKARALNEAFVRAYAPTSVPQYWFGGRRVDPSQLNLSSIDVDPKNMAAKSTVKLKWQRYQDKLFSDAQSERLNMALVMPSGKPFKSEAQAALLKDERFNWYVFDGDMQRDKSSVEFFLLNDITPGEEPIFLLEGKPLTPRETRYLINQSLRESL